MKLLRISSCLIPFAVLVVPLSAQTTIQNTTYTAGQNVTVSDSAITANTAVTVSSGADVKFRASTSITLGPGFTASSGSAFRAFLSIDTDGDGLDDAWESTHGLNPNNAADAATDLDGDGLTNLQEYLLGTNPNAAAAADPANTTQLKITRPQ
jgi:hypothetical protein